MPSGQASGATLPGQPVLLRDWGDVQIWQDANEPSIARVWLNRPKQLNALEPGTMEHIIEAFELLQRCFHIAVVVLCGAGRSFCAGMDLRAAASAESAEHGPRERRYRAQLGRRMIRAVADLEAVTIARVQGHAIGGGFGLLLACDMRVVMQGSILSLPEMDLKIPLTWGLTAMLARDVGMAKAKELIMLCDELPLETGLSLGLINRVSPPGDEALDRDVDDFAFRLASKDRGALHMAKTQFRALQHAVVTGDTTEHDGDYLLMQRSAMKAKL